MRIRICEIDFFLRDCHTRLPFRFGVHTMTAAPLCLTRVVVESEDGAQQTGFSSDLLVPKWFEKTPGQSIEDDWLRLLQSAGDAKAAALEETAYASVFDHWWALYDNRVAQAAPDSSDLLVRGEGVSLIERAMIDAACRLARVSFIEALRMNLLGFEPGRIDDRLRGWAIGRALPQTTPSSIAVRHTVGLVDALSTGDLSSEDRVKDGLPESLEDDLRAYGLTHFKIKLSGDADGDIERLGRIAAILRGAAVDSPQITLDGNEQFDSIASLHALLERARSDAGVATVLEHLRYIEQPLARAGTFDAAANAGLRSLPWPCIIDEADATIDSFPQAIDLGYRGVSIKNCKGVFRSLINRARCDLLPGGLFQSAEDLTNLPVIALQQDLATASVLGMTHIERNGHHYFRGLDHLSKPEQEAALDHHRDLYRSSDDGAMLDIRGGRLSMRSIHACAGYGYDVPVDLDGWISINDWSPRRLLSDSAGVDLPS